jgi:hypothetical protein
MEYHQTVRPSGHDRLHARIRAKPNGRIYVKFDTGAFIKICRSIPSFLFKNGETSGNSRVYLGTFLLFPATQNYHSELFSNDMVLER